MAQLWSYVNDGSYASNSNPAAGCALSAFAATTGNSIVVCVYTASTSGYITPTGISDTAGNGYGSPAKTYQYFLLSTYYLSVFIYVCHNITGHASNQVTVTLPGTGYGIRAIASQISGLSGTDTGFTPAGNLDTSSPISSTTGTTAEADECVLGLFLALDQVGAFSSYSPSVLQQAVSVGAGELGVATNHITTAGSGKNVSVAKSDTITYGCMVLTIAFTQAGTTLTVADLTHSHNLDGLAAIQSHMAAPSGLSHGNNLAAISITAAIDLIINSLQHGHSLESIAAGQTHIAIIQSLEHAQNLDSPSLSSAISLIVSSLLHIHSLDSTALTQMHILAVDSLQHVHDLGTVDLTQSHSISVSNLMHEHNLDSIVFITAQGRLTISFGTAKAPSVSFDTAKAPAVSFGTAKAPLITFS